MKKAFINWSDTLHTFWEHYPALYFAFLLSIGCASYFFLPALIFALPFLISKKRIKGLILLSCGFIYPHFMIPSVVNTPAQMQGIFRIDSVKKHQSPFNSCLVYEGHLNALPCRVYLHERKNRPLADKDYFFPSGTLTATGLHRYIFKPTKWIPIKNTRSLAEKRYAIKEKIKQYLSLHYKTKREHALMAALLTGQLDNRLLAFEFGQVGLQHLLAISGFHFALLGVFLFFILKKFLSQRGAAACLLALLTLYFFYMGSTPSISRAWIGVFLFLTGTLFHFRPTALNALGLALLCALLSNPLILLQIGFQLSFGATLGILLFYRAFEQKLRFLLPKRTFEDAAQLKHLDQWGYLLAGYIRRVLALNGAVLMFVLPLLLFHFHKFPLLSLVYNLFYPLLFSGLMALLFLSLLFPPLHALNKLYAIFLLDLVTYAPKRLMFYLRLPEFPLWILGAVLTGMCLWGIHLRLPKRIS